VKDILTEGGYDVTTAPTAHESLAAAKANPPELILLDYVLPDMRGDEVTRRLREDSTTAKIPVIYMSGLGTDLRPDAMGNENVIGSLNKPFTSDLLIKTVESHMPKSPDEPQPHLPETEQHGPEPVETVSDFGFDRPAEETEAKPAEQVSAPAEEWWSPPPAQEGFRPTAVPFAEFKDEPAWAERPINQSDGGTFAAAEEGDVPNESVTGGAYFCGDTRFFSLNWALQTIAKGRLTGKLRSFWNKEPIDLFTKDGEIVLATTNDPELYCAEAPITLANVDQEKIAEARAQQRENGCPIFITLAKNESILQEPSLQLVQHYGQKLFAHLWSAPRVRFMFEQGTDLPEWAGGIAAEGDVDHWALATLRLIQFQDLGNKVDYDSTSIPAYTRDGFDRVQNLRLTVAEAQFASQFNGVRSIQQIAKNLRLDLKFARLTLFRFIALEIVECWPAAAATKPERTGMLHRLTRSIGIGD
jgi:CheY-like chemotaxis protein